MNIRTRSWSAHVFVIAAGLAVTAAVAGESGASGPNESGQSSPATMTRAPDQPSEHGQVPPPDPAKAPTVNDCLSDRADFKDTKGQALFVIELTNACDRRIRCVVDAYVTTAKGPTSGHATLTLPGKAGATTSYAMKIGQASGMANTSRSCRFL